MSDVRVVFIATDKESKEVFMPFYREVVKKPWNLFTYNRGPVCTEIQDRNVVVTHDEEADKEIIEKFGCACVELTKDTPVEEGLRMIEDAAKQGV